MAKHIIIHGKPTFVFYDSDKPNIHDIELESLIDVTDIITELSQSGGEVANITVNIDNVNGDLTRYLNGWFNSIAEYYQDGVKIFEGQVDTINSSNILQLTVGA